MDFAAPAGAAAAAGYGTYLGAAVAQGATLKIIFLCVDGEAQLDTPNGKMRLRDVQIGDKVLNGVGEYRSVVRKDYGQSWPERAGDYLEIVRARTSIILTKDHLLYGKPAGELKEGEHGIIEIRPATAVPSGDIMLDDDSDYVVNGFVVSSMFSHYKITESATA